MVSMSPANSSLCFWDLQIRENCVVVKAVPGSHCAMSEPPAAAAAGVMLELLQLQFSDRV